MVIVLSPVVVADEAWVLSLFKSAKHVWPSGGSQEWFRFWQTHQPSVYWMKATLDGVDVGFAHWRVRRDGWRTLYDVVVSPDRRGGGVGRYFVDYIGEPIRLKVLIGGGAEGFYEHLGFREVGQVASRSGHQHFRVMERGGPRLLGF